MHMYVHMNICMMCRYIRMYRDRDMWSTPTCSIYIVPHTHSLSLSYRYVHKHAAITHTHTHTHTHIHTHTQGMLQRSRTPLDTCESVLRVSAYFRSHCRVHTYTRAHVNTYTHTHTHTHTRT